MASYTHISDTGMACAGSYSTHLYLWLNQDKNEKNVFEQTISYILGYTSHITFLPHNDTKHDLHFRVRTIYTVSKEDKYFGKKLVCKQVS